MEELDLGKTVRGFRVGQKVFRRFTLMRILGRGGMGVVWLAKDEELEREVALKFLPDLVVHDPAVLDELKRETRRSLELTHHHIVRTHDFVQDAESACISMEYVDGPTLSALRIDRANKVFETRDLAPWIAHICEALQYAHHSAMIVHRDIKPANLMLNSRGDLKVADFGIARSLSDSMTMLTMARGPSGTLAYMSPQQLDGDRASKLDDIYSLGATLYELLTSKPPFHSGSIERLIREKTPPSLAAKRQELGINSSEAIPEAWERTIAACLAKNPVVRPQTALEVRDRLQGTAALPPPPSIPSFARTDGFAPQPIVLGPELPRFVPKRLLRFSAIGLIVALLVTVGLTLWLISWLRNTGPTGISQPAQSLPMTTISPEPLLPKPSPILSALAPSPISSSPTPEARATATATATATAEPSPISSAGTEAEELAAMVATHMDAGSRGDAEAYMALYADRVDFLDEGGKSREEIAKDLPQYYAHWPTRRSKLIGRVRMEPLSDNEWNVNYQLDFAASNSTTGESRQSIVDVFWVVRRENSTAPFKIVSHKQRSESLASPTPAPTPMPSSDPAVEIVKSYIVALNKHDAVAAFRHLSAAYRARNPFNQYSPRVAKTGVLTVDSVSRGVTTNSSATIELSFREQEPTRTLHWHGTIAVVLEGGQWRIDSLSGLKSDR
ncbi:MAG: eukaryotic-like serine/threonine-protein kinase [Verrucomicrobiota bacterium]|jgi:serine/threonine protein kinase